MTFGGTGGGLFNYSGYLTTGAGVVPTIAPVSISPSSEQFAPQNQGTTTAVPLTAVVTNNDSTDYGVTSITIFGANAGDFALVSGGANNCLATSTLAPGASCTLHATFTPTNVGTRSARILVYDGASNSPQTVYLTGTGQWVSGKLQTVSWIGGAVLCMEDQGMARSVFVSEEERL